MIKLEGLKGVISIIGRRSGEDVSGRVTSH
jgi:hypothetical protein